MKTINLKSTLQKRVIYFLILSTVLTGIIYACKKQSSDIGDTKNLDPKITAFVNAKDFLSLALPKDLLIDNEKSKATYFQDDLNSPILHLVLNKGGKIVAIIDAIKNINKNISLPNDAEYFMLYRNVSEFDFGTLTGKVELVDLNYEKHKFQVLEYMKGVNKGSSFSPIPLKILQNYSKIIEKNRIYLSSIPRTELKKVPCDANGDGNLSFSECYACLNGACQTNSDCYTLCYAIGDVVGWVATGFPHCQASIGAACIYLSIKY